MKNLKISIPLVDGSLFPLDFKTGKELINNLITNDWAAPPRSIAIEAKTDDGKKVVINIIYDDSDNVSIVKKIVYKFITIKNI